MTSTRLAHRLIELSLAERLGLSRKEVEAVDTLVDNPRGFAEEYMSGGNSSCDEILGRPYRIVAECMEMRGVDPGIITLLYLGMVPRGWHVYCLSSRRRGKSAAWLEMLRVFADCAVAEEAGVLAEIHVLLSLISRLGLCRLGVDEALSSISYLGLSSRAINLVWGSWTRICGLLAPL